MSIRSTGFFAVESGPAPIVFSTANINTAGVLFSVDPVLIIPFNTENINTAGLEFVSTQTQVLFPNSHFFNF